MRARWVLVLALVAGIAATGWSAGKTEGTASGAAVSGAALPSYNLLWYFRGKGPEKDEAMIEDAANKYLKDKINATIRIVCIDRASFPTKMTASIASGEAFDIAFTAQWLSYIDFAQKGAFVALNDPKDNLLDKYLSKTKALLGPNYLGGSAIDGVQYAIPVNKEQAHSYGVLVRKDMVDKYKIDVSKITSFEALEPGLKAVKDGEPSMPYPLSQVAQNSFFAGAADWSFLIDTTCPVVMYSRGNDLKMYNAFERPETLKYFDTSRKYYLAGYVKKDAANSEDYVPDLQAGKIFAKLAVTKPGAEKEFQNSFNYTAWVPMTWTPPTTANSETMGAMNAISVTSKDKARAAMFMELTNTDKYLNNLINYGIEGTHWVKVSDNVIDFAPATNQGKSSGYNPTMQWGYANQFLNYLFTNEDPNKWKNYDVYNKSAVPDNALGFIPDLSNVKTEVSALHNVWREFMPGLETGSSDPAVYVPQALAKFKAAGVDKVIADMQKQYDAWRARNPKK